MPQPKPVLEGQLWPASHPKGKSWDARGREGLFAGAVTPCPCQSRGGGEAAANAAWKRFNFLSESNRPAAAAEDRTSSAAWKE